jgi:hypothetical protein
VALAREWDRLVAEIRDLPGFADYLRPRRFATLAQAASEGPIVIVNLSSQRCDALIVTGEGVEVLPLPALVLTDMIDLLNGVYASFSHPPADIGK